MVDYICKKIILTKIISFVRILKFEIIDFILQVKIYKFKVKINK